MKEKNILYTICKLIYKPIIKILYRPKAYGIENIPKNGGFIFAGNHIHAYDPIVVMSNTNRNVHFMAKESLFKGFHGLVFYEIGLIKVSKDKFKNAGSIIKAEEILNNGYVVGIFPEGTRNRTDKDILPFRKGTVRLAKNTNTRIVPFAIRGSYKRFKKGLEIEFGKPIDVSDMSIEDANALLENEVEKMIKNK